MKKLYLYPYKKIYTLVDDEEFEKLNQHKWYLLKSGYVFRSQYLYCYRIDGKKKDKTKAIYLHREIMGFPDNKEVDHKDHNKLNNCKSNLRVCTTSLNQINRKLGKDNTSGFKGVTWDKSRNKWKTQIKINNRTKYLGRYDSLIKASNMYKNEAIRLYGEFAYF